MSIIYFLILLKLVNNSYFTDNYFSLQLIYDEVINGIYTRQVLSDKYLCVLGSQDVETNQKFYRYIVIYDRNTGTLVKKIKYLSNNGLVGGEAIFLDDNSQYLLIVTATGSNHEIINIQNSKTYYWHSSLYGYRRQFLKYYKNFYEIYISDTDSETIINSLKKITGYNNDFPSIGDIASNSNQKQKKWSAMISCDLSGNNIYVVCAYYSSDLEVTLAIYNSGTNFRTEAKYEKVDYYTLDNFIKIVYLRNTYNFVIVNSQSDSISRFRYYKYNPYYERFDSLLAPIINNGKEYLDNENIQRHVHNGENDIIAVNHEKIVQLYVNNGANEIIITIFQFYNSDSALSIKSYYLKNNEGFNGFLQARINMLKNSFLISAGAGNGVVFRPSFFLVNYPNSKDIQLTEKNNIIIIKDLIHLDNCLFDLQLKFKILQIPKDFIFIKLNSEEIKENEELELSDQLRLRKYRINEGSYIFKYEAIAYGYDTGYSYLKIYPPNFVLAKNKLYFGGRQGQITINFKNCLNGYYHLDYDLNLCTNIIPRNYYIDEVNKIYKACQSPCEQCSGPIINDKNMNCITCRANHYMTEDTNSCYDKVIDNYYLDKDKILKRCHSNCLRCSSAPTNDTYMNCLKCQDNYYMTEDTNSCYNIVIDNYYLDSDKILKRCYPNCLRCSSAPSNDTYMNCLKCQKNYYMTEDTNSCYDNVIDNYYLDKDKVLKRCHSNCLKCNSAPINETYMNCLKCQNNYYMTEDTNSCYDNVIDNYYLDKDKILRRCHSNCLRCSSAPINETHMNCLKCQDNYYITEDTNSCYDNVIDNYYLDSDKILKRCYPNCLRCSSAPTNDTYMNCLKCQNNYYMTEDTNSCYDNVIDNYYLDKDNILKRCHQLCLKCYGAPNEESMNCIECINDPYKKYFYKKDVFNCILPNEFEKRENIEFEKINNNYFWLFIVLVFFSLIFVALIFILCKSKDDDDGEIINENEENLNTDIMLELKPINNIE